MAEQELRDYVVYELEAPHPPSSGFEIDCALDSKYYAKGTLGTVRFVINASVANELDALIEVDGKVLTDERFSLSKGLNDLRLGFDTESLDTGRVKLKLSLTAAEFKKELDLEILVIDSERISKISDRVSQLSKQDSDDLKIRESLVTIEWKLDLLQSKIISWY